VVITESPDHADDLAASASEYTGILVAGGDGTVFDVLQGMDRSTQSLAILPAGRGNSLARDLQGAPRRIDLMQVAFEDAQGMSRCVLSASTVAVGYPAAVAETASRRFRFLGTGCYAAAAALTRPEPFGLQVRLEGGGAVQTHLTGVLVNNTQHIANFLAIPRASVYDGVLDAMELRRGFVGQGLHNLSALLRSSYEPVPAIRTSGVQLSLERPSTLLIDGELLPGVVSVHIRVFPSAVTCSRVS
jgi:diacylglycerol kinase family enzyme